MNPTPTSTPAPIHDIAPPIPFFPYPPWMVVLGILCFLALIALLVWIVRLAFFRKQKLHPFEEALIALTALRYRMETLSPHDFGVEASAILRHYIHEEYGLRATTQTSLEFLESIQDNAVFSQEEKDMLRRFLESADLLKFAKVTVQAEETTSLLQEAEQLVRMRNQHRKEQNAPNKT